MTHIHIGEEALTLIYRLRVAAARAHRAGLLDQAVAEISAAIGRIERMIPPHGIGGVEAAARAAGAALEHGGAEIVPLRRRRTPGTHGPRAHL